MVYCASHQELFRVNKYFAKGLLLSACLGGLAEALFEKMCNLLIRIIGRQLVN